MTKHKQFDCNLITLRSGRAGFKPADKTIFDIMEGSMSRALEKKYREKNMTLGFFGCQHMKDSNSAIGFIEIGMYEEFE